MGSSASFLLAVGVVLVWAASGPYFNYSDTWQLVINTGTTIITFLIVFLIQATQNRDTKILNLKLDELLRAVEGARNEFLGLAEMSDADLEEVQQQFSAMAPRFGPLIKHDLAVVVQELDARRKRQTQ